MLSSLRRAFTNSKNVAAAKTAAAQIFAKKEPIPGVSRVILAASCKGGVGKSTVALNTAVALSEEGNSVGLFDADVYGPSIPTMVSTIENQLGITPDEDFVPISAYGIETVSIGNVLKPKDALLWKGPAIHGLLQQLLKQTSWPSLDYMVIDSPPGTGDVQMSLNNLIPIDGAVLITSPQNAAASEILRNIDMFKKMKIPILGIIQNFDGYLCPCCNKVTQIFPGQGRAEIAKKFNLELLGSLPIDPDIADAADEGFPAVLRRPNSKYAATFRTIAKRIMSKLPPKEAKK